MINSRLLVCTRGSLLNLLDGFEEIYHFDSTTLGDTSTVQQTIDTGEHRPLRSRPYRGSQTERQVI